MKLDDYFLLSTALVLGDDDPKGFAFKSLSEEQAKQGALGGRNYLNLVWREKDVQCFSQCVYQGSNREVLPEKTGDSWALFDVSFLGSSLKLLAYVSECAELPLPIVESQRHSHLFVLPLEGVFEGLWCSGPCGHILPGGSVASMLAPGVPGNLKVPCRVLSIAQNALEGFKLKDLARLYAGVEYLRQSMVAAIRYERKALKAGSIELGLGAFSLEDAVGLLLLRQSFPGAKIVLISKEAFKDWPKSWKHLTNCLGVEARLAANGSINLNTSGLTKYISKSRLMELARHLNGPSKMLAPFLSKP